jgi:hypothetical protein
MGSYALLVGVSKFDDPKLAKLTAPEEDVQAFAAVLRDPARGGFDAVEICIDRDLQTIREQLSTLLDDRRPDDMVLFYYSGHGIMAKGQRLFLATGRSSFDRPQISSLWASEMRELLEQSRAGKQVVILDCCHSGGFAEGAKGVATPINDETFGSDAEGQYVLTATDALQFAYDAAGALREGTETGGLSRFTSWLVDGLGKGEAATGKELITLDELFEYLGRRARAAAAGMTPKLFVKRKSGDLVIAKNPNARPASLPKDVLERLDSADWRTRKLAIGELEQLAKQGQLGKLVKQAVLDRISNERDTDVREAMADLLAQLRGGPVGRPDSPSPEKPPPPIEVRRDPPVAPAISPPIAASVPEVSKLSKKASIGIAAASSTGAVETPIGSLRRWLTERPAYLLALTLPPILFATWQLFRLPIPADNGPILIFIAAAVVCGLALLFKSRSAMILVAMPIGVAFVLKPALVPFEGFVGGATFPYTSETAENYWLPSAGFIIAAAAVALTAAFPRLVQDFKRLRPDVIALVIAIITAGAGFFYFNRPTLYDVYLPFRPQYALLREHLVSVAAALDQVARPFPPARPLDVPLVIDERGKPRDEDASTTGHLFLYQHLTKPDEYFGDIEGAVSSDLHLHLRDTGNDPVLYETIFTEFESSFDTDDAKSLTRAINAPYLVVVKPLMLDSSGRVDTPALQSAAPYRVFLFNLKRDEIIFAADIPNPAATAEGLKEQVNCVLQMNVGAKILRPAS